MNTLRRRPSGFTMIELIVVIVVLGILAATALPKFVDFGTDARAAALQGMAGAANSAMTINYGGCAVSSQTVTAGKCVKVSTCSDVNSLLQTPMPSTGATTYAVTNTGSWTAWSAPADNGKTASCTITQTTGSATATATFTAIAAAN